MLAQTSLFHTLKDISLINGAAFVHLLVAQLKVDVGVPGLLLRLPLHPALKHLPAAGHVPQHLLHVGVLVPVERTQGRYQWLGLE